MCIAAPKVSMHWGENDAHLWFGWFEQSMTFDLGKRGNWAISNGVMAQNDTISRLNYISDPEKHVNQDLEI